jgi:lipopolysaccharide export system protein LptC
MASIHEVPVMSWRAGLTLILLVIAIVSGWSLWRHSTLRTAATVSPRSEFVLRDFELVALDTAGKESFTLRGPRLQRDIGTKSMTLDSPLFLVPDRDGAYWEVRARSGHVPDDGKLLQLRGQVVATSPLQAPPPTRIETEALNLYPGENRATSSLDVTIHRPGLTMRGRGLRAEFDRQQVSLLSDVRAHYVPSSR